MSNAPGRRGSPCGAGWTYAGIAAVLTAVGLEGVWRDWSCPTLAFPGLVSPAQPRNTDQIMAAVTAVW